MNPLHGLVSIEGDADGSKMNLTIDLENLTPDGKGRVAGNIDGREIKGTIDPNKLDKPEIQMDQTSRGLFEDIKGFLSGQAASKIEAFKAVFENISQVSARDIPSETEDVTIDITLEEVMDRGFIGSILKGATKVVKKAAKPVIKTAVDLGTKHLEKVVAGALCAAAPGVGCLVGGAVITAAGSAIRKNVVGKRSLAF